LLRLLLLWRRALSADPDRRQGGMLRLIASSTFALRRSLPSSSWPGFAWAIQWDWSLDAPGFAGA